MATSGLVLFLYAVSRLAHVLRHVAGVLLFAPLLPLCQRLLDAWLPDQPQPAKALAAQPA